VRSDTFAFRLGNNGERAYKAGEPFVAFTLRAGRTDDGSL
jgi:hypothetical protein